MSRRQTSQTGCRSRAQVLEVRVMSPRIAWFGFCKFLGKMTKLACILAFLSGMGWGVWKGVQHVFYQNPDFRLQVIDLNPNPVIDEASLAEITGIDLTASLFNIDLEQVVSSLKARPEIAAARAERHLPGTLVVRIVPRTPIAWVATSGATAKREIGAMLTDHDGIAFPCPALQLETAAVLPIIYLPASAEHSLTSGEKVTSPELRHCFRLIDSAGKVDPQSLKNIESIRQINAWSLELVTRDGVVATFGLGDHDVQMARLQEAMDHASVAGYALGTINLIPKHNIPITLKSEPSAPRATPVLEPSPSEISQDKRSRDLKTILNRN